MQEKRKLRGCGISRPCTCTDQPDITYADGQGTENECDDRCRGSQETATEKKREYQRGTTELLESAFKSQRRGQCAERSEKLR